VILIIAILAALITIVSYGGLGRSKVTKNRTEIGQLEAALEQFRTIAEDLK